MFHLEAARVVKPNRLRDSLRSRAQNVTCGYSLHTPPCSFFPAESRTGNGASCAAPHCYEWSQLLHRLLWPEQWPNIWFVMCGERAVCLHLVQWLRVVQHSSWARTVAYSTTTKNIQDYSKQFYNSFLFIMIITLAICTKYKVQTSGLL